MRGRLEDRSSGSYPDAQAPCGAFPTSAGSSKSAQLIGYTMDTTKGTITIHIKL